MNEPFIPNGSILILLPHELEIAATDDALEKWCGKEEGILGLLSAFEQEMAAYGIEWPAVIAATREKFGAKVAA